jgi:ABC-type lipoprotein release transport system permease subunit
LKKLHNLSVLAKVLLSHPHAKRMLTLTTISFAFSIAVILCTIGLMDGFESTLRKGLHSSSGDILLTSERGFFEPAIDVWPVIKNFPHVEATMLIESEAFLIHEDKTRGVIVRGIDPISFSKVTDKKVHLPEGSMMVGHALAEEWKVKKNDELTLALAKGHPDHPDLPMMVSFPIADIIRHGVYEKDSRMVYLHHLDVEKLLDLQGKANLSLLKVFPPMTIENYIDQIQEKYGDHFSLKPYWQEFTSLLEAVFVEKVSISIILQLIVLIAIFNIAAMTMYFSEKRAQEFFLVQALGMSQQDLIRFWLTLFCLLWAVACVLAYNFSLLFNFLLQNWSWLKIPGDIYVIDHLQLKLESMDYLFVYFLSFAWIMLVGFYVNRRVRSQPIIHGLRMETA